MTAPVPKRLFLMDDSAFALDIMRTALVEVGMVVTCGRDLADLARLEGEHLDLVLMDVEMPEAFGDDVAAWLIGKGLDTPVYLVSSLPDEQLAHRALECGARGYISKRGGIDGVVGRVQHILDLAETGRSMAPTVLVDEFLSMAGGRLRRAEAAIARGDRAAVVAELHTLAGEASLLGLVDLARAAEACRCIAGADADASPLAAVAVELAAAAQRAKVPLARPIEGPAARLLLLDDSDFFRSTLMALLEDSGYEVVEARRLPEARHRMREGRYDLAILDLQLEDGRGSDLIPELRVHAPRTPLLLLSGDASSAHGADLVLSKLIEPDDLLRQIQALIAGRA